MIIVCSGPDTYRAREKARDLVSAFRAKHDASGLATEVIDGAEGLPLLLSRLGSASLFHSKKMIRADGCLEKMKIADVRSLAGRLEADRDNTIILTVENESPNAKTLDALKSGPLFHYSFPYQVGLAYKNWVRGLASALEVPQTIADTIADYSAGDSWFAVQELAKQSANPHEIMLNGDGELGSVFDVADLALSEKRAWRNTVESLADDNFSNILLGQARAFLRVRDQQAEGLHPFAVKKLLGARVVDPEAKMRKLLRAHIASRTSLAVENETENLI